MPTPMKIPSAQRFNVGSGPIHIRQGWINVDIRPFEGVDLVLDVTESWPCTNTLEYVYGEHFLEHLSVDSAFKFLDNVYLALRIGGILRLTTPSLEWVLSSHFSLERVSSPDIISQTIAINRAFYGWGHKFLYSKKILEAILLSSGFIEVCFCDYGDSEIEDLRALERHSGYTVVDTIHGRFPSVWIIEARKSIEKPSIDLGLRKAIADDFISHVESGH